MSFASLALGFGLGVLAMSLLTVPAVFVGGLVVWRLAQATERAAGKLAQAIAAAGIDITIKPEK